MAYATIEDLERRWRPLDAAEIDKASALLDDAAVMLDAMMASYGVQDVSDDALKAVSCSMVRRSMALSESGMYGISQGTISADIYSQSLTYANPTGDMYLTSNERRMIGLNGSYIGSIPAKVGACV